MISSLDYPCDDTVGLGRHRDTVADALAGFGDDRTLVLQADVSRRDDVEAAVAVSSVSGIRGDWGQFAYNATKGAGVTMLQSLALDLGPDGIRVNMVAPAMTVTRITEGATQQPGFEDDPQPRRAGQVHA